MKHYKFIMGSRTSQKAVKYNLASASFCLHVCKIALKIINQTMQFGSVLQKDVCAALGKMEGQKMTQEVGDGAASGKQRSQ